MSASTLFNGAAFDVQQANDDFDIITLNIDEEFPIDPQADEILFKNDHQFDLASYIGGESTSLLLSPVNDVSARRRMMSLSDFGHIDSHNTNKIGLSQMPTVQQTNANHDKVAKTPASNRRKRKNLSREFIETSDSEDEKETSATKSSIHNLVEDSKRNKRKEDDPMWIPNADKRGVKTTKKPSVVGHPKQIVDRKDLVENKKAAKTDQHKSAQGNGLRNMLKQQLLSDRPMNKGKLLKTMSMPTGTSEKLDQPKVVSHPVKRMGVGRGKDIQITAKYYNCETSDNYDVRDKSSKQDRFHQIYTDSDTSESESSSSSSDSSESDGSDIEVNSEPTPLPKEICKEKQVPVAVEVDSNKKEKEKNFEKKPSAGEIAKKNVSVNANANKTIKPIVIDSNSLDSTDFARALVTNTKKVTKAKPAASKKKTNLEQQKRLIQSNMLLQNPAKFRIFADDKNKTVSNGTAATRETKIGLNVLAELKPKPANIVQELPKRVEKLQQCAEKEIKREEINDEIIDVVEVSEENVKPDVVIVEESKVESSAKRKLNIQEYLKRKSLKTLHNSGASANDSFIVNIKTEQIENDASLGSKQKNNEKDDEASLNEMFVGNSMYEEIIIVSMGCNTDISIPEASFIQPSEMKDGKSVLLSDIQTSVEKANSKISSMSLISSIQDVILKKTQSIEQNDKKDVAVAGDEDAANGKEKGEKEAPEHGENKVIMHLRKDRVRPTRVSTSIQTDPYFQFPPLEKLAPVSSKKQSTMTEKRMASIPRSNEMHFMHSETKNRMHRNYRGPSHLSESSYYSDDDDKSVQRRSRHSDFMEHTAVRHRQRSRRESSRYSSSKYDKYLSRHRTISRSLSSSSDNSTTSTDSTSSSQSSSSSSTYVSSASARSLNSYGGSSSKSYYGDDHQYYRIRTTSNNSRRSNYRQMSSKRSNSPGLCEFCFWKFQFSQSLLSLELIYASFAYRGAENCLRWTH